jgi:hypothetical protein
LYQGNNQTGQALFQDDTSTGQALHQETLKSSNSLVPRRQLILAGFAPGKAQARSSKALLQQCGPPWGASSGRKLKQVNSR